VLGACVVASSAAALAGCLPEETVIGPSIDAIVESELVTLDDGTRISALDAVPLSDGSLLVDGMAGDQAVLVLAPADGRSPEILGEGGEIGAVRSIASAGAVTLVVGERGVVAIENGALFRVPIEPMLETMEVRALAPLTRADGTLDFLVATDAGLFVVVGDQASPIEIEGAPLVATHLAPRPRAGDVLSAWAADESGLVRITLGEGPTDPPALARLARLGEIEALASDDEGRPWWVEDGVLFSMTRDQRVILRALPMPAGVAPSGLTAIAGSGELWVHGALEGESSSSALFHFDGHVFRSVTGAIDGMTIRCATASECLGFDGTGELARIAVRHGASLEGLLEGASLHEPVTIHVAAEAEDAITSITADVSGTVVPVEAGELVIDPAVVGFGPRTLVRGRGGRDVDRRHRAALPRALRGLSRRRGPLRASPRLARGLDARGRSTPSGDHERRDAARSPAAAGGQRDARAHVGGRRVPLVGHDSSPGRREPSSSRISVRYR
jgi:hypothetical protein